ncbi:unnamed protein product [Nippostrongylus brasiliensis]|uniref:Hsp90 co-chaperone (Tebp), putative (inferred by orthology to a S. mansoni protein) n=1 Tax=Nippostrongylus brasiliensis TaxID=27835 RepID=A0A0N4YDY5_NIPBR|nr:unnamed protein product [Nippostrongylus brasiliensis]
MAVRQPPVTWAQRESFPYVTIEIDDVTIEDLTADSSKLHFKGTSHTEVYEATLQFFDEIVGGEMKRTPTNTKVIDGGREKGKVHWLKVDFDKWKDEDDSGAEDDMPNFGAPGGFDLNSYMSQMNNGAGGGAPDFDGLDDDDMPDLEDDEKKEAIRTKRPKRGQKRRKIRAKNHSV